MKSALLLVLAACGATPAKPRGATEASSEITPARLRTVWPDGCLTIGLAGKVIANDEAACTRPRRPYSTFKLANALIGLDAGVLENADSPMTWDSEHVPINPDWPADWMETQPLRHAIAISAVPLFRTLALQLGQTRMTNGLAMLRYGNQNTDGGLDHFWLGGGLRISARQQLAFVDQLAHGTLSATAHAQAVVREISELARGDGGAVLHGKTGSGPTEEDGAWDAKHWLVWQVGWIERPGGEIVPYAAWLEWTGGTLDTARDIRTQRIDDALARLGLFKPSRAATP